jgi:hypothetical protein
MDNNITDINTFLINNCGIQSDILFDEIIEKNLQNQECQQFILSIETINNKQKNVNYINSNIFLIFNLLQNITFNDIKQDKNYITKNNIEEWAKITNEKNNSLLLNDNNYKNFLEEKQTSLLYLNDDLVKKKNVLEEMENETMSNKDTFELESYYNKLDIIKSNIKSINKNKKDIQQQIQQINEKNNVNIKGINKNKNILKIIKIIGKNINNYQYFLKTLENYKNIKYKSIFNINYMKNTFCIILFCIIIKYII